MDSQEPKKRTRTRKVKEQPNEKVELTVEEPIENKYAPKKKVRIQQVVKKLMNN